ncbi:MAG: TAXI family TRAP transporter solute-binding subunit, partial [Hydrogenophaga sp.]
MNALTFYRNRWLLIRLPLALAGLLLGAAAWTWLYPMPKARITLSSGLSGGAYQLYAARYAQAFAQHGIECTVLESAGSGQNLTRLRASPAAAELAFVQGGFGWASIAQATAGEGKIETLVEIDIEALWLFARSKNIRNLEDLRGMMVAVGPEGSGHRVLFQRLLAQQFIAPNSIKLSPISGPTARDALDQREVDAVFMVASPNAPVVVSLMSTPGIVLASLQRTAGMADHNNFLQNHLLPQDSLGRDLPPRDVAILTTPTHLLTRSDLDPALKRLATAVAMEVHSGPGIFHRAGEYPLLRSSDFPAASESRQVLKRGLGVAEQLLPFWWTQILQRLLVIGLPLLMLVLLLGWLIPMVLRWRLESRITRWYGELKFIEH